jgi:hypothetical protein
MTYDSIRAAAHRLGILIALMAATSACAPAMAEGSGRSPVPKIGPIPRDVTPRVQLFQCGDFKGHFGPIDFRTAHPNDRRLVEGAHFDMELQTFLTGRLSGRNTAGTGLVTGGFWYTLKAFPNHPIALKVMEEAARKMNTEQPEGTQYPLECWYLRAFMIAPDDPMVRALYGIYLARRDRAEEAIRNLEMADLELQDSRAMQFLIGETYLLLKQYERAQRNAMRAANLGYPGDFLEKRLREAGQWNPEMKLAPAEAVATVPEAARPTASSAAK